LKNITLAPENPKIFDYRLLSELDFIRSIVCLRPQVDSINGVAGSVDSFPPKVLREIIGMDHDSSHLLNHPIFCSTLPFC